MTLEELTASRYQATHTINTITAETRDAYDLAPTASTEDIQVALLNDSRTCARTRLQQLSAAEDDLQDLNLAIKRWIDGIG